MTPQDAEDWMQWMIQTKDDPLHPDLLPYFETGGTGALAKVLRHPLVYQVPFHHPGMANEAYLAKVAYVEQAESNGDIDGYVFAHERPWRLHALTQVMEWDFDTFVGDGATCRYTTLDQAQSAFAECVSAVWIDSENIWQNLSVWKSVLTEVAQSSAGRMAMDDDEQDVLDGLPETVAIWRGAHAGRNEEGFSWTLNREVARWFSTRFLGGDASPVLVCGTVSKSEILGVFEGRGEEEVVVLPGSVTVTDVEPVVGPTAHPGRPRGV